MTIFEFDCAALDRLFDTNYRAAETRVGALDHEPEIGVNFRDDDSSLPMRIVREDVGSVSVGHPSSVPSPEPSEPAPRVEAQGCRRTGRWSCLGESRGRCQREFLVGCSSLDQGVNVDRVVVGAEGAGRTAGTKAC